MRETLASKFRNAGQTCVCANRIFVQAGIYDAFSKALAEKVAAMKVGNGAENGVAIGPLIDAPGLEKVARHVDDAKAKGAEAIVGGMPMPWAALFADRADRHDHRYGDLC